MAVLIRLTGIHAYPEEAVLIDHDDLQKGLEAGEIVHVEADIYRQVAASYQTKVMEPYTPNVTQPPPVEPVEDTPPDAPPAIEISKGGPWFKITVNGTEGGSYRGAIAAKEYLLGLVDEAEADRLIASVTVGADTDE